MSLYKTFFFNNDLTFDKIIDEIINSNFNKNILELKTSAISDAFFKSTTRASPFPCVFISVIPPVELYMIWGDNIYKRLNAVQLIFDATVFSLCEIKVFKC